MINRLYGLFLVVMLALAGGAFAADATCPTYFSYDDFASKGKTVDEACTAYWSTHGGGQVFVPSINSGLCQTIMPASAGGNIATVSYPKSKEICVPVNPPGPDCKSTEPFSITVSYKNQAEKKAQTFPSKVGECKVDQVAIKQCWTTLIGVPFCQLTVQNSKGAELPNPNALPVDFPAVPKAPTEPRVNMPPTALNDKSASCPGGSVSGGVTADGMTICIGTGTAPTEAPTAPTTSTGTVSTQNPDGGSTSITTTQQKNADGSTTTFVTTSKIDGNGVRSVTQTSSTSAVPSTGNGTSTAPGKYDDPKDQDDLCKRNPTLTVCKNSTVNGTCREISCEGDAIQCQTLRAAAIMQCAMDEDKKELKDAALTADGKLLIDGADPKQAQINEIIKGKEVDVGAVVLDQAGFAPRACLSPRSFSVMGQTVAVDFAVACQKIEPLRYAIIACCSIIAYLIVSKSIVGS